MRHKIQMNLYWFVQNEIVDIARQSQGINQLPAQSIVFGFKEVIVLQVCVLVVQKV